MDSGDSSNPRRTTNPSQLLFAQRISPVFPVTSIVAALQHYEQLGFETEFHRDEAYAFLRAGRAEIHLTSVPSLDSSTSTSACYLYVEDVDALYESWSSADIGGRLVPPADTDYGLREFAHIDIDGNLIRVGSPLA
jgi:hypothetical protein